MNFEDGFYKEQDEVKNAYDQQRKERHDRWKEANPHKGKQEDATIARAAVAEKEKKRKSKV